MHGGGGGGRGFPTEEAANEKEQNKLTNKDIYWKVLASDVDRIEYI